MQSIIRFNETLTFNKIIQIQNMPLWHNSKINIEHRKEWEKRGYHTLSNLLNENGELISKEEMFARTLKIHFLDYFKLSQSVRKLILHKMKTIAK